MKKRIPMYWLVPSAAERELFRELIRILAEQFDAPKFEPHLTLCEANRQMPGKLLRLRQISPVQLRIRNIAHSPKFTKTLYVRCVPNRLLKQLVSELGGGDQRNLPDPHISLLYKKMPASTRRELAASIKLPFRQIRFDLIKAVNCNTPTETAEDVESWRVVATKKLPG